MKLNDDEKRPRISVPVPVLVPKPAAKVGVKLSQGPTENQPVAGKESKSKESKQGRKRKGFKFNGVQQANRGNSRGCRMNSRLAVSFPGQACCCCCCCFVATKMNRIEDFSSFRSLLRAKLMSQFVPGRPSRTQSHREPREKMKWPAFLISSRPACILLAPEATIV